MDALAAGLERLDRNEIALREIFDPVADLDHLAAEFMPEDHGIRHARERMRLAHASRDGTVVVLVQIAAAEAVVAHAQLHVAGARFRFRDFLEADVAIAVVDRCTHGIGLPSWSRAA